MKKSLIVLAAALVALVGCKKDPGSAYTKLEIKQAPEISIEVGETAKLNLVYEPTTLEAPVCEWSSSDTTKVKVDQNGNVTGIALGEANVTAQLGEKKAVCKVNVKDMYDMIEWGAATWWSISKTPLSNDTVVRESTSNPGNFFHCVPILATFRIWDTNVVYDEGLTGVGFIAMGTGCVLLITDSLDQNGPNYYYLGRDSIRFVAPEKWNPYSAEFAYSAPAGLITGEAEANYQYWFKGVGDGATYGTEICIINWDDEEGPSYEDPLVGFMGEGLFVGDESFCKEYDVDATWFDGPFNEEHPSYCGLALTWVEGATEEESGWDLAVPHAWAPTITKHYTLAPANDASRFGNEVREFAKPIQMPKRELKDTKVLVKK